MKPGDILFLVDEYNPLQDPIIKVILKVDEQKGILELATPLPETIRRSRSLWTITDDILVGEGQRLKIDFVDRKSGRHLLSLVA
jgi:hypothetical protein